MTPKRTLLLALALCAALMAGLATGGPVRAQDPQAWAGYDINVRTGPGQNYSTLGTLGVDAPVVIEGRNAASDWMLLRTPDGALRGWSKARLFRFADGVNLAAFPVSEEILPEPSGPPVSASAPGDDGANNPANNAPLPSGQGELGVPFVPRITGGIRSAMRAVYVRGLSMGNNPRVFSKVGDCQTDHWGFLKVFGWGNYDLSQYDELQPVIDHFKVSPRDGVGNSFDVQSLASHNGFNSSAVRESQWADPNVCQQDEKPLLCEYRLNKPAVSIIMFGTADVLVMDGVQYRRFMRNIIEDTIDRGIIPILSTFPENPAVAEKSRQFNQIVLALGREYSAPVMNLADALRPLPNWGLDSDGIHLTLAPNEASGFLTPENLQYGYSMRNLIVLQTLDAVWRGIMQ
ncbi:MAG: hypothetical protein IT323_06385 [Anaerolineae bacterium]|nr:hypothetical protein [Anaerolineae bacterium]